MFKDYVCKCGKLTEYKKPYGEEFPESVKCEHCGSAKTKKSMKGHSIIIPEEHRSSS
jgi:hypothetical protein